MLFKGLEYLGKENLETFVVSKDGKLVPQKVLSLFLDGKGNCVQLPNIGL